MKFLDRYNNYKQTYIINEGSIKSITTVLQDNILDNMFAGKMTYQQLSSEDQQYLNKSLQNLKNLYQQRIEETSNNKQYQSWIYDRLANYDMTLSYFVQNMATLKEKLHVFETLCKSPTLSSEQKNIMSYNSIDQLFDFIAENKPLLVTKEKLEFEKVYSNNQYDIYKVSLNNKDEFQHIYGPAGYDCGWCIVNPDKNMFEYYLKGSKDCYYLWTIKNTSKPYVLVHFKSGQFKDIHNKPIMYDKVKDDQSIIDGLSKIYTIHTTKYKKFKNELFYYSSELIK